VDLALAQVAVAVLVASAATELAQLVAQVELLTMYRRFVAKHQTQLCSVAVAAVVV
jgi:hypothetical protein